MPSYNLQYLNSLIPFSPERKSELVHFFKNQNESVQLEAFFLMLKNAEHNRAKRDIDKQAEYYYASFLLALDAMKGFEEGRRRKGAIMSGEIAGKQLELRVARVSAKKQKSAKVKHLIEIRYYHEIKKLRKRGLSWRQIADYLNRFFGADLSFTYLRTAFKEIEKTREGE